MSRHWTREADTSGQRKWRDFNPQVGLASAPSAVSEPSARSTRVPTFPFQIWLVQSVTVVKHHSSSNRIQIFHPHYHFQWHKPPGLRTEHPAAVERCSPAEPAPRQSDFGQVCHGRCWLPQPNTSERHLRHLEHNSRHEDLKNLKRRNVRTTVDARTDLLITYQVMSRAAL